MRSPRRRERGAVTTIVALLMGMGVVFGVMAIGVDVGNLLWERRQLQNAADAAALSLATECGKGAASCTFTAGDETEAYADRNSQDGESKVVSACQVNIGGSLSTCPTPSSDLTLIECPPLPGNLASMTGLPYVEVRTQSLKPSGGGVANWFAGISGGSDSAETTVHACSRAAIGTASGGNAELPLSFSGCDWEHATGGTAGGGGGAYYPSPVYNGSTPHGYGGAGQPAWPAEAATPPAQLQGQEVILLAQNPPGGATPATPCPTWNGHALPGGFGVLETQASDPCKFVEYPHHWMHTSTGNNMECDLSSFVGKVVSLPIFDCTNDTAPGVAPPVNGCTTGAGNNAYYHRAGFAQFYLSGYSLNVTGSFDNFRNSLVSGKRPCNGADRCISGWFLSGELSATAISGPPGGPGFFGSYAVVPAG